LRVQRGGKRQKSMQTLGGLMRKVYPSQAPDEAHAIRLLGCWSRVVPERILRNARPVFYRAAVLTIHTTSASWANALSLEAPALIAKLRARAPDVPLQRMIFRMGRLPDLPEQIKPQPPPPALLPIDALPEDVARELARVSHDGLRERLSRAIAVSLSEPIRRKKDRG
jgi:hypothetical protein